MPVCVQVNRRTGDVSLTPLSCVIRVLLHQSSFVCSTARARTVLLDVFILCVFIQKDRAVCPAAGARTMPTMGMVLEYVLA